MAKVLNRYFRAQDSKNGTKPLPGLFSEPNQEEMTFSVSTPPKKKKKRKKERKEKFLNLVMPNKTHMAERRKQ